MRQYLLLMFVWLLGLAGTAYGQTPAAHYAFTGHAKDGSGFANHAAVNGANLTQDRFGIANHAFFFDGEQSGLTAPNAAHLNSANATISFWINPASFPAQGEAYLLSFGGWQQRWKISLPGHGKPVFTTHSNGACCSDMDSNSPLPANVWTHVTMVHNGTQNIIYFNGVEVNQKSVNGALDPTTHPLGIGYDPIDNANYFHGALDEVMLFDQALSAAEIAALYNQQNAPPTTDDGTVASYAFKGNGADGTPFGNHLDLSTAALSTDRFGFGKSALLCNGQSSEAKAPNSNQLNSPYATVSFWVKVNNLPGNGEAFLLSFGGWQERWKISLPPHGKPVWTTNHSNGISDMDSGDGNALQPGVWTHVTMVHDGAKDKIFINGAQAAEKNVAGTLNSTTHILGLGYNPIDGGNWFDGSLDDIQLYNYALSDAEIAALYAAQAAFPGTPSNLVAHYSLNGDGNDDTPLSNHAALENGAAAVANRHDWASNALEGAALADNSPALQSDHTIISFWVRPNSYPGSGEVYLMSNGGWQERWKISMPSHGKPVFTTHSGGACCADMDSGGNNSLPIGEWTHFVMVHDGEKDKIFFNGVLMNERNSPGALDKTKHPLGIGFDPIDGGSYFDGAFDDVQIYNTALSNAEIAALYDAQNQAPTVGGNLVAHYAFSGNSRDETAYSNHASASVPGKDRFGKANKAAAFDGEFTEVKADNSPQLNSPQTTVAFWVRPNSLPGNGEAFLLSFGGWQERWKISLPPHGKPVWTTNHTNGISDMDSGDGNALEVGEWTHVAMVHDGLKNLIYMDGALVAQKDVVGNLNNTTRSFGMGYNPIDGGNWFDGLLDEVQVYNTALSAAEIAALYTAQSQDGGSGDDEAPCSPLNLTAGVSFNNVSLDWLPATDNVGVVAYNVYIDGVTAISTAQTTAYFPGLTPLRQFEFGVTAIDEAGNESLPTTLRVTTGPDESPDVTPPTMPGNLAGSPSFNAVLLSWTASTDDRQVAGYYVWVDGDLFATVSAATLSVLVGGLEPLTLYSFEVAAFDMAGNVSEIAEITLSTTAPLDTGEPGLVAHYPFDGNANDATPYQNHGVIGGNPTFETPNHAHGGAFNIRFDGVQDSVLAPNAVQLISDFTTVSFWIRVDDRNLADAEAYVLDFGHWNQRWKISLPQHLKIVWTTNSNNAQFTNFISDMDSGDGNEMVLGFWWYVTMVHDGQFDIIYVNGQEVNRKPVIGKLNSTGRPLCFGNNPIEGGQYFIGALDNVKIYNKALTASEISALYATGTSSAKEPDFAAAYIESAFPNPATETLTVRHSLPSGQDLLLRVFDLTGRQLDAVQIGRAEVASGQFQLDVRKYPAGSYSLNFILGGKNIGSLKFNKQ